MARCVAVVDGRVFWLLLLLLRRRRRRRRRCCVVSLEGEEDPLVGYE